VRCEPRFFEIRFSQYLSCRQVSCVVKVSLSCHSRLIGQVYKRSVHFARCDKSPRRNSTPALAAFDSSTSMRHTNIVRAIAFAVCAASVSFAYAADISGAGATFPFHVYAKWADAYKKETGDGLNYQSIGSGAGIK
jgi:hypothetical protein